MESPLVRKGIVKKLKDINIDKIIESYKKSFNLKVFDDLCLETIELYECKSSHYQFFYPFNLTASSSFYEELEANEWYYKPWKWEHEVSLQYIKDKDKVLEVGCAKGDFLLKLKKIRSIYEFGLEINNSAIRELKNRKISYSNISIQEYAELNVSIYDVVCSYQVLEHITDVYSFLEAKIKALKKGGYLVISVPNNASFIKYDQSPLNMPPHHMGLWNERSLKYISKIFNIKVRKIHYEPLQDYHVNWYYNVITSRFLPLILIKIFEKFLLKQVTLFIIRLFRKSIKGHSILIVFQK